MGFDRAMTGLFDFGVRCLAVAIVAGVISGLGCGGGGGGGSVLARDQPCPGLPIDRPGFNSLWRSTPTGNVQVIGRQGDQHYGVVIPSDPEQVLAQVQICVQDAFLVESRWGSYIQAGFFYRRVEAEALSKALESQRIDSRVVYYP
jgi:hypothetical protein